MAAAHLLTPGRVRASGPARLATPRPGLGVAHGRAAPSPGPDLSLTFQVLFLAQEAAGGCHGDRLWVSAKDASASSQPPQPAPAPRGPRLALEGVWGPQAGVKGWAWHVQPHPEDTPGRGQHSQVNHKKTAGGPPHARDSGRSAPSPQLTKGARRRVWACSPGHVVRGPSLASLTRTATR